MSKSADELLQHDQRPPILYLRSFADEAKEMTAGRIIRQSLFGRLVGGGEAPYSFEQRDFAGIVGWVGPYIALTRPGERKIFGAARKTVQNNEWKTVVSDFIRRAGFIILRAATSPGLQWEIGQIVKNFAPTRLLFITPGKRAYYKALSAWVTPLLPKALPERLPPSRLIAFDHAWGPYPIKPRANIIETMSPFFRQHGINFPRTATEAYVRQQKTGRPIRL